LPAICLLLLGLIGIPAGIGVSNIELADSKEQLRQGVNSGADLESRRGLRDDIDMSPIIRVVRIATSVVVIVGSLSMLTLEGYPLAVTGAVLAIVPCLGPCCGLGFMFGIWALVRLSDSMVKSAFRW
jgi:hypothetical protein